MSNIKFNQSYIDAWTKAINSNNEQVVCIVTMNVDGAVSVKAINNLGTDTLKHLFDRLHKEIESQAFLQQLKAK